MSYVDSGPDSRDKIGCFLLGIGIFVVVAILAIIAILGDCAPEVDRATCESDGLAKFLMFPGSAILGLILIAFYVRWMVNKK